MLDIARHVERTLDELQDQAEELCSAARQLSDMASQVTSTAQVEWSPQQAETIRATLRDGKTIGDSIESLRHDALQFGSDLMQALSKPPDLQG